MSCFVNKLYDYASYLYNIISSPETSYSVKTNVSKKLLELLKTARTISEENYQKQLQILKTDNKKVAKLIKNLQKYCKENYTIEELNQLYRKKGKKKISTEKEAKKYRKMTKKTCNNLLEEINECGSVNEKTQENINKIIYNFVPREVSSSQNPYLELFFNLGLYAQSFSLSWSDYLLYHPTGFRLIDKALSGKNPMESLVEFASIIKSIYIRGQYDEMFQKNMFSILPQIDKYFGNKYEWVQRKLLDIIIDPKIIISFMPRSQIPT